MKLLKYLCSLTIFTLLIGLSTLSSFAQQLDSAQIKSAYLFNFIKHVEWPEEANKKNYIVAVYQEREFFDVVANTLNNRVIKNKPISVIFVNEILQAKKADVVFVSVDAETDIATIASELRKTNTLLVTDNSLDKHNIMINLVFNPDTQAIAFEVNKSNIVFEQLTMSSELLLLGGTELDVAALYRETEVAMQKMRRREVNLQQELIKQNAKITETTSRLNNLNSALQKREAIAEQRQVELIALKKDIDRQKQSISIKEEQLKDVATQLSTAKSNLAAKQKAAEDKEQENKEMANRIAANKSILNQQQSQIDQQEIQLIKKNEQLAEGKEQIDQQRSYITILAVLIITAILVGVLVIWLFIKNKRTTRKLTQTLTNLKNMQDQLVQSEKLASLGKLTAGVAHEINTPLGISVTSTSSSLEATKKIKGDFETGNISKSQMSKYFQAIEQAAELNMSSLNRVIELLNNFKQVAADQVVGELREINCTDYINEIMQTLSAELKRFRVQYQYRGEASIKITTIPGAIAQVLTNLVTNSLKHGFENQNSGNIFIDAKTVGDKIQITYADDGQGMGQEVLQNIFEPFFTTKRNSGGTGLGMNIVYNIVNQKLHGSIKIESKEGQGARFIITLPSVLDE
ncbi:YfiR/HmsC family protein [Colwelliaceae bacterium 6441]